MKRHFAVLSIWILLINIDSLLATWIVKTNQTVDTTYVDINGTSIAIDINNYPCIVYRYNYGMSVASKWNGASWDNIWSLSGDDVGSYPSVAIGTDNIIWASCYVDGRTDLMCIKCTGVAVSYNVDQTLNNVGRWTSIAVDSYNYPHIAYQDVTNTALKYAKWNGASWTTQTIDSYDDIGYGTSIAIDSNNCSHIAYMSYTDTLLKYAKWNGASWVIQTVDSAENVGEFPSITIDSGNYPHIAYYDATNTALKYAKWNGLSWVIQTVDSLGDVGKYTSIKLDSNNYPLVAYFDNTNSALKYAKWNGLSWIIDNIIIGSVMGEISLGLDSNKTPHISYRFNGGEQGFCVGYVKGYSQPKLSWSGETGYTNDAVEPNMGYANTNFNFRVMYTNIDSTAPATGYPKLNILQGRTTVQTLVMNYVSGTAVNGMIFSVNTLLSPCSYYSYNIEVKDCLPDNYLVNNHMNNITKIGPDIGYKVSGYVTYPDGSTPFSNATVKAIGLSTITTTSDINGYYEFYTTAHNWWNITVSSQVNARSISFTPGEAILYSNGNGTQNFRRNAGIPVLSWTGEVGYVGDGIQPDIGVSSNVFTFRVKYTDYENDAPSSADGGYPKVTIKKGVLTVYQFVMNYASGSFITDVIYSTSTLLSPCSYYSYTFEVCDKWGAYAINFSTTTLFNVKAFITGKVMFPDSSPMANVIMNLQQVFISQTQITDSSGRYQFSWLNSGEDYILTLSTFGYYSFNPSQKCFSPLFNSTTTQDFIRINRTTITWTGETNYETDGLNPDLTLIANTTFTYRIRYIDADNDSPISSYPKLRILRYGTTIQDIILTEVDSLDNTYTDGKTYYHITQLSSGRDYSYYFIVRDSFSLTAQTDIKSGPIVSTSPPVLAWTGETGYTIDGINPEFGPTGTTFYFRVKYIDSDNDPPKTGYPKLHMYKNSVELPSSPYTMLSAGGTNYINGVIYYCNVSNLTPSLDYTYIFEVYDEFNKGPVVTSEQNAPDVNTAPTLSWTGETNYIADGLHPEINIPGITFYFRVKYTDPDNQPPATGYPKLHIKKNGIEISSSPFTMNYVSGIYQSGAIYSASIILNQLGTDYSYYFEAYDVLNTTATGVPTTLVDAPDIVNNAPILLWAGETNYISDGVQPDSGTIDTTFVFKIKHIDIDNQPPVTGYPKLHILKNTTEIIVTTMSYVSGVYNSGAIYSVSLQLPDYGEYRYYFETQDNLGASTQTAISSNLSVRSIPTIELITQLSTATIKPGEKNNFQVKYTDSDNSPPDTDYPQIKILLDGHTIVSASMTYSSGTYITGAIYSYTVLFTTVSNKYSYYCQAQDSHRFGGLIKTSSQMFTVSSPPIFSNNTSIAEGQTVTGGKVVLSWLATDNDGDILTYYLCFGDDINNLQLVYSGSETQHELESLESGKTYFWRVDVQDSKGILTKGSIHSFKTLSISENRVYNYPNPFNPNKSPTNIVFNAEESGTVEIEIYTEFGDKLFEDSFTVPKGVNTYQYSGRDGNGEILKSGTYIVIVKTATGIKKSVILILRK